MKKKTTHTALLETGITLFGEKGYHGTGIKDVVDTLDVPKGSFYNYFKSKEHYATEIVHLYSERIDALWETAMASANGEDPLADLAFCFTGMIDRQAEQPVASGCLIGNLAGELAESSRACREALNQAKNRWCDRLTGLIAAAQEEGAARNDIPADTLSGLCWDVWEGALLRMKLEGDTNAIRNTMTTLFTHLLRPSHGNGKEYGA